MLFVMKLLIPTFTLKHFNLNVVGRYWSYSRSVWWGR